MNHRDTEAQRTSQTRRHEGTKAANARKPQITQINADRQKKIPLQRIGHIWVCRRKRRRSDDRRLPGESTSTPDASVRRRRAVSRTPRLRRVGSASPLSCFEGGHISSNRKKEQWRGLRSSRTQAAGSGIRDESSLLERLPGPAVPGRRPTAAGTSPRVESPWTICVYLRDLRLTAMSSCLCVFVFAMCAMALCPGSVSLCLCGSARAG